MLHAGAAWEGSSESLLAPAWSPWKSPSFQRSTLAWYLDAGSRSSSHRRLGAQGSQQAIRRIVPSRLMASSTSSSLLSTPSLVGGADVVNQERVLPCLRRPDPRAHILLRAPMHPISRGVCVPSMLLHPRRNIRNLACWRMSRFASSAAGPAAPFWRTPRASSLASHRPQCARRSLAPSLTLARSLCTHTTRLRPRTHSHTHTQHAAHLANAAVSPPSSCFPSFPSLVRQKLCRATLHAQRGTGSV